MKVGAVQEYFHVDLTTEQDSLTDNTTVTVDLGGSGTVKYDTKSNVDTSNDARNLMVVAMVFRFD